MSNIIIREVQSADQESIIALLIEFYANATHWKKLFFNKSWRCEHLPAGYVLCCDDKIVGYLGLIFSYFDISDSEKQVIGNITTWYVKSEYRRFSMMLLKEALSDENITWTNLTASNQVAKIFSQYGFIPFATEQHLIFPIGGFGRKTKILLSDKIIPYLNENDKKIYFDHQGLPCMQILLKYKEQSCYVILVKTTYKKIPVAKIYYVNNISIFSKLLPIMRLKLCFELKVFYLFVETYF